MKRYAILLKSLFLLLALSACGSIPSSTPALTAVTIQLSWLHQAEFAGLYAADQLGYFAAEGLRVNFVEGGPQVDFIAPLLDGRAQFGVAQPADVITGIASGKSIKTIAVIYRRSPIVFFTLRNSGITHPQDFAGRKIRSTTTVDLTLRAMMAKVGIPPDQYQIEYLPSDVSRFAAGDVPVWAGFINIFVLEVQRAGYELNLIYPDDYGIHFYGDVLITTDDAINQHSDLVLHFTRAALKGWTYVVENPASAGAFVQKYNPKADQELENARMAASIPLINTGEDYIGWMKPDIWAGMEQTLRQQGVLTDPLNLADVYTAQYLEAIYAK